MLFRSSGVQIHNWGRTGEATRTPVLHFAGHQTAFQSVTRLHVRNTKDESRYLHESGRLDTILVVGHRSEPPFGLCQLTVTSAEVPSTYPRGLPPISEPLPPSAADFRLVQRTSTSCGPKKDLSSSGHQPAALRFWGPVSFWRFPAFFLTLTALSPFSHVPLL